MDELDPRFKIRAPLRCDGIGRLDCAEDLDSGMRMAVRWLPLEANGTAAVEACEQLPSHPTLPRIRQIGQMGASAYVAMEFPDGKLLSTHAGETLDSTHLIGITSQIADALATIHFQDVFHGEMSADSVLLVTSPSEKAFLWDMPLVIANRLTDRRGEERLMTQLVKTAPYLAPERARGTKASAESDVYALGAIICVAGGAPLPVAETTLAVVHAVVSGTWAPKVPKSIPEPLRSTLERMIARAPEDRPSAREVANLFMPVPAARTTLREMAAVVATGPIELPLPPIAVRPLVEALWVEPPMLQPVASPLTGVPEAKVTAPMPATLTAVALTDSVTVSQELHQAGAVLLSAEEAMKLVLGKRGPLMVAALVGVMLVLVLGVLSIVLASRAAQVGAQPVFEPPIEIPALAPAMVPPPVETSPAEALFDDELAPLTPLTPRPREKKTRRHPSRPPAIAAEEQGESNPTPTSSDFGFLNDEPELKRPSF